MGFLLFLQYCPISFLPQARTNWSIPLVPLVVLLYTRYCAAETFTLLSKRKLVVSNDIFHQSCNTPLLNLKASAGLMLAFLYFTLFTVVCSPHLSQRAGCWPVVARCRSPRSTSSCPGRSPPQTRWSERWKLPAPLGAPGQSCRGEKEHRKMDWLHVEHLH